MRNYNYLQLFALCYFLFTGVVADAQVRLKVALLSDSTTYQVSLLSEDSYSGILGLTNSAQVSLKVPTGGFSVDSIASSIGNWGTPQVFASPQEAPAHDYLVFSTGSSYTHEYVSGVELILFTFENSGTCTGGVEVTLTNDPFIENSLSANIGNAFTILGFGASNAFAGAYEVGSADCTGGNNNTDCGISISTVFSVNERTCEGNDGSIQITAFGGTGSLEYSIDNGNTWSTSAIFNDLAPGDYMVKVRELSNPACEMMYSFNPTVIKAYFVGIVITYEDPSCSTAFDGSISIGTDSQDNSVLYSINNGATFESTPNFTGLGNGRYDVVVSENNSCEISSEDNPIIFNATNTCVIPSTDTDSDGISDMEEDLNGDGNIENDDTDGDGTPNYRDTDDDGDNIMTSIEAAVPNGGDGNDDGILDCLQDSVGSQLSPAGTYHTLVTTNNAPIIVYTIITEEAAAQSNGDELYNYPYNLDGFMISSGGSVPISIIYHGVSDITNLIYRKYGPTTPGGQTSEWYDFPHTLSTISVGGVTTAMAQLTLTDNQMGDSDAAVGRIVDPGGLALLQSACDITYILSENNGVYEVSMASNVTYSGSQNTIASMQVTIRVPTGTVTVDNTCILDTYGNTEFIVSTISSPTETPTYDYISFNINGSISTEIPFNAGQAIPLFTFKNIGDCPASGNLELVGAEGIPVPALASANVASQLSTVGGGIDQPICVDPAAVPITCQNSTATPANTCDVTYILTETNGIYEVSMTSDVTYTGVQNTIASMQVSMRAPAGMVQIDETCILDTYGSTEYIVSTVPSPSETPTYDYISFTINGSTSSDLSFTAGETIPLFTFKNIGDCSASGGLELLGTGGVAVPDLANSNVASQLSTVGGGIDQPICVDATAVPITCPDGVTNTCDVTYVLTQANGVYQVNMASNVTYTGTQNTVASMQVSFRAPTGTVQIDETCILDTYGNTQYVVSTIPSPSETPTYDYFSFTINGSTSSDLTFTAGQTIPLFSFKNIGDCPTSGFLELVGTGGVVDPNLSGFNAASQLSTVGGGIDQPICVESTEVPIICAPTVCDITYILEGPEDGLYTMKMYSDITLSGIQSTISTMQITMRTPTGTLELTNDCIEENYAGTVFELASQIINPPETPGFDYFSFSLTSFGTNSIPFVAGDTATLFTFKGLQGCDAEGDIYLVGNNGAFPIPTILAFNLPSQLFVLGGGGEDSDVCVDESATPIQCQNPCPDFIIDANSSDLTDCGSNDGQIVINATPSDNAIYSIDGGETWSTNSFFSELTAGTYTVEVAASDTTCNKVFSTITITGKTPPSITSVSLMQPTTCNGTGSIEILTSPSTGLIYSVDGGTTWTATNSFSDIGSGNYDISIAYSDTTCITAGESVTLSGPASPIILNEIIVDPSGCGATNGLIQIATIPSTGLIYSIDGGTTWNTSNVFPNLGVGNYQLAVANADETCITTGSIANFTTPESPNITSVAPIDPSSCDESNGQITITASNTSDLIYSIDGGATWSTNPQFSGLAAGLYSIRAANTDTTCTVVGTSLNLDNPTAPVITTVSPIDPSNCSGTNGQIAIGSIPSTGLIYSIDGGTTWSASASFENIPSEVYTINVANADTSCVVTGATITLQEVSDQIVSTLNTTDPTSSSSNDGCIEIITSCVDVFEYSLDGTNWQTSNIFCDLGDGTYSVRVRCLDMSCSEEPAPIILSSNNVSCATITVPVPNMTLCIESSMPISLTVDETIASYTIEGGTYTNDELVESDTTLQFNAQLNGLINFFTITIQTASGCELVEEFVLYQAQDTEADFVVIEPFCKEGEVTIQFTGNATPNAELTWSIDGGTLISSSPQMGRLPAGSEIVVQWDTEGAKLIELNVNDNGCTDDHVESIFVRKLPLVTISPDTRICFGDSTTLEGGGTGVWYTWSPAESLSDPDIQNPVAFPTTTTTYTLDVMGADGCVSTTQVTVMVEEVDFTISPDVSVCIGDFTDLNATGGVTYAWSPTFGLSDPSIPNPTARPSQTTTYTVTITNENGCSTEAETTVTVEPLPSVFILGDPSICEGESSQLEVSTHATYAWSPSAGLSSTTIGNPVATPASTTTYLVTVTSETGCTSSSQFTVEVLSNPTAATGGNHSICNGQTVQLSASGGGTYAWSPTTDLINSTSATPTVSPSITTTYTVVVTGANGCTDEATATVEIRSLDVSASSVGGEICPGEMAQLTVGGGTTYTWSPTAGLNDPSLANPEARPLVTTEYCVTVMDAEGCTGLSCTTVVVDNTCTPPNCSITTSEDVSICEGKSTQLTATGSITYTWSPTTGLSNPNIANPIASPNQTTTYTVTGTSDRGCVSRSEVTVTVEETPFIITYREKHLCVGDSIYLLVNNHANYAWSPTNTMLYSDSEAPFVFPTTTTVYTVTVTGENGCTNTDNITVNVSDCDGIPSPDCSNGLDPVACEDKRICNGESIQLVVTTHAGYAWSPSTSLVNANTGTPTASPTVTTTYTVTVNDANGCTATDQVTVFVDNCGTPLPTCQVSGGQNVSICQGESMTLNGFGAATYSWSPTIGLSNPNIANPIASPNSTTSYIVTGTSADGCVSSAIVTVEVSNCGIPPTTCQVSGGQNVSICQGESMTLNGFGAATYSWSPTEGLSNPNIANPVASPNSTTSYIVTGTSADNCVSSAIVTVEVSNCNTSPTTCLVRPEAVACEDKTIECGESIRLVVNNHAGYAWSPSSSLQDANTGAPLASPTVTTTYTVTVTDADGCTNTDMVTVFVDCGGVPSVCANRPVANAGPDMPVCAGSSVTLQATGGINYQWSPTNGLSNPNIANPIATPNVTTVYRVMVTDANGCSSTDDIQLMVSLPIVTTVSTNNAGCCGEGGGSIFINASGGFGNLNYAWSSAGLFGNSVSDLEMGSYTVTISDAQGCSKVETISVGSNCVSCPVLFETAEQCAAPGATHAEVCLPIHPDNIHEYTVTVDGIRVFPNHGCAFENTVSYSYAIVPELSFSASFRVNSWTINGVVHSIDIMTIADLTNWMNSLDGDGKWILDNNILTLTGGAPTSTYGSIEVVNLIDWTESVLEPSFTGVATGILLEVDVSDGKEHQVVVEHPTLCCRDELIVSNCIGEQPCLDDMIAADLIELALDNCSGETTFCIEIPYADISNYSIRQNGNIYEGTPANCSFEGSGSGTLFTVEEGDYEFIFENSANGCQDRLLVTVSCPENVIFETKIEVGDTSEICLTDIIDESLINSVKQTCLVGGNEIINVTQSTDFCWQFDGLTEGMERFCLELCTTDGVCRNIIQVVTVVPADVSKVPCINIIEENSFSASITDCFDKENFCISIPMDSLRNYSMLLDGRPYTDALVPCEDGFSISIEAGRHLLSFTHRISGCTDEISFKVDCTPPSMDVSETVQTGESGTYCPDGISLPGAIISIENICPEEAGNDVTFELDTDLYCIHYTGEAVGSGTACLVVCDANGICDTINLTVNVLEERLLPDAISDSLITEVNVPITMRVMENDKINGNLRILEMTSYPEIGEAIMNDDFTITYTPENEFCEINTPQTFEYRICNEEGCDTTYIKIRVPCQDFEINTGLSPNGDGVNDVFYIQGLQRFPNNELQIFNRWGNVVYSKKSYSNDWSGTFEEQVLPSGTYFYILRLGDNSKPLNGYVQIQR